MRFSVCHIPNRLNSLVSVGLRSVRSYSLKTGSHYEVLGVGQNATRKEIKAAFIEKSKKLHPDRNANDPKTHDKFIELNEAYTTLSDPGLRSLYDARKGFMGRYSGYPYSNHGSPYNGPRPTPVNQDYYYTTHRNRTYEEQQKQEAGIRERLFQIIAGLIGVYIVIFYIGRKLQKVNTIDIDYKNWIRNHHEAKDFRDKMYVQRILTDYYDSLDHKTKMTLRSIPRSTRYQILLEMYEEKMNLEAEERAKAKAEREEQARNSKKPPASEEINDDKTMTLQFVDVATSSSDQHEVTTS